MSTAKPPVVYREDVYPDWQSAREASGGYATEEIFTKVRDAARAVRDGKALWERDSVLFYREEYNLPLLAALMSVAAWNRGRLCVLDFGGALGSTYGQHRSQFRKLAEHTWNIVEQPHVVKCGKDEFENEHLKFWSDMEECCSAQNINVILFSGVLQYLENPYAVLEQAAALRPAMVLITRTSFAETEEYITVQHVPASIFSASYPCRWLDRNRINGILEKEYRLLPDFNDHIDPSGFFGFAAVREG